MTALTPNFVRNSALRRWETADLTAVHWNDVQKPLHHDKQHQDQILVLRNPMTTLKKLFIMKQTTTALKYKLNSCLGSEKTCETKEKEKRNMNTCFPSWRNMLRVPQRCHFSSFAWPDQPAQSPAFREANLSGCVWLDQTLWRR